MNVILGLVTGGIEPKKVALQVIHKGNIGFHFIAKLLLNAVNIISVHKSIGIDMKGGYLVPEMLGLFDKLTSQVGVYDKFVLVLFYLPHTFGSEIMLNDAV
jgi:hypothetical protein